MRQLLDQLDDEWTALCHSPSARRALATWAVDPALAAFPDLPALVETIERRGHPAESDRMLLALLRRASSEELAARTVLQALMLGLKALMATYQQSGTPDDVATAVIEAAFERIRCYPRPPSRPSGDAGSATDELVDLVGHAVREARLPGARLILLTRVLDVTVEELADETASKPQTIRKRRRKAEALLAAAVA